MPVEINIRITLLFLLYIICITDKDDKLISFAITMPSYSRALQKANGSLLPFGWYHLLNAGRKNERANFYLIGIHPEYQTVVFRDTTPGFEFLSGSTQTSNETVDWEDGNTYPLIRVEISSDSHPFYTGKQKFAQADGRIDRFNKKYGMKSEEDEE